MKGFRCLPRFVMVTLAALLLIVLSVVFSACDSEKHIPVTGIRLDKTEITLAVGDEVKITAEITPEDATDKQLFWRLSEGYIASTRSIYADGYAVSAVLEAVGEGAVILTVSSAAGDCSAKCKITVRGLTEQKSGGFGVNSAS